MIGYAGSNLPALLIAQIACLGFWVGCSGSVGNHSDGATHEESLSDGQDDGASEPDLFDGTDAQAELDWDAGEQDAGTDQAADGSESGDQGDGVLPSTPSGLGQCHWVGGPFNSFEGIKWAYSSSTVSPIQPGKGDSWAAIEVTKGQYSWEQIDQEVALAQTRGKKVWLQIQTADDRPALENIPQWALDEGVETFHARCGSDSAAIGAVWDPKFRERFGLALEALGSRYRDNSVVVAVVVMGGGNYGEMTIKTSCYPWNAPGCTPDVLNPACDAILSVARVSNRPAQEIASKSMCDWQSGTPTVCTQEPCPTQYGSFCYVFEDYFIKGVTDLIDNYARAISNKPLVLQDGSGMSGMARTSAVIKNWAVDKYGSHVWLKFNGWGPSAPFFYSRKFNNDFGKRTRHGYEPQHPDKFSRDYWSTNGGDEAAKTAIKEAINQGMLLDKSSYLCLQSAFFDITSLADRGGGKLGNKYYFNPNDATPTCANSEIDTWCPGYLNSVFSQADNR